MKKALEMGRTSAAGGFQLFLGRVISTVIMAVGTIILGGLILPSDYGLYTVALIPATTFLLFQDWGVSAALTRHCAKCRTDNSVTDLRKVISQTIVFELATGVILTIILVLASPIIAETVFNKPESSFLIAFSSSIILFSAISNVPSAVFVGFERMGLSTIVLIAGSLLQSATAPILVALGYGATGAIVGYAVSTIASCIVSVILLFLIIRPLPKSRSSVKLLHTIRSFIHFGGPYAGATILGGLVVQFVAFMMASYCDTSSIGVYKIATNFAVLATFFTIPISTILFPAFSKVDPTKERLLLNTLFTSSTKYASLLLVPATLGLIALGQPLIETLYGTKWIGAPFFLSILILSDLLVIIGSLSLPNLLLALGETRFLLKTKIVYLLTTLALGLTLIPLFGMAGVLFVSCVAGIPSIFVNYYFVCKKNKFSAGVRTTIKIFSASLLAFAGTFLFVVLSPLVPILNLVSGCLLFAGILLIALPSLGAINRMDIETLHMMFESTGFISKFLDLPLLIMQRILDHLPKRTVKIGELKKDA